MKIILFVFSFFVFISKVHSQEWVIVDIVNQNSKELFVMIDNGGEKINRKKIKKIRKFKRNFLNVNLASNYLDATFIHI